MDRGLGVATNRLMTVVEMSSALGFGVLIRAQLFDASLVDMTLWATLVRPLPTVIRLLVPRCWVEL